MKRNPFRIVLGLALLAVSASFHLQAQDEMIANSKFDNALESWIPMNMKGAVASFDVKTTEDGKHAICITVPQAAEKRYYVQLDQTLSAPLTTGKTYTLSFRAKSTSAAKIVITIGRRDPPAAEIWRQDDIALHEGWQDYSFSVAVSQDATTSFLNISGLSGAAGEYWFTNISLKLATKPGSLP